MPVLGRDGLPAQVAPLRPLLWRAGARRRLPDALQHGQRIGRRRRYSCPATSAGHSSNAGLVVMATGTPGPGGGRLVDLDPDDLGRRLDDRRLDGGLEGDRRGRAPVAAAEQPQPDGAHVVVDAEQLDVAAVGGQERVGPGSGRPPPARQRDSGWRPCTSRRLATSSSATRTSGSVRSPGPGDLHHLEQAGAVEVDDQAQQPRASSKVTRIAGGLELVERLLDPIARGPQVLWCRHGSGAALSRPVRDGPPGWASASSSEPCPCRGTCAPRRAGTGRSCAPTA